MKLGEQVKIFDTGSYSVAPHDIEIILADFDSGCTMLAFLLKSHGLVAASTTLENAQDLAELIEETAKIHILSRMAL